MSSSNNSTIGQFEVKPGQGGRESYQLVTPAFAAIEGLDLQHPGNNCIYTPKPRIINATNIDTESVVGQVGVNRSIKSFIESDEIIQSSIIEYNGYVNDLPAIGAEYHYNVMKIVWIGSSFNQESLSDLSSDFIGMKHNLPPELILDLDLPEYTLYPIMSYPGFATSILYTKTDTDGNPRSLLVIGFCLVVITPGALPVARLTDYIVNGEDRLYPSVEITRSLCRLTELIPVEEYESNLNQIIVSHSSGTYDSTFTIQILQKNPGYPIYASRTKPEDLIAEGLSGDPVGNNGYYVDSDMSLWFYQLIGDQLIATDEISIVISLPKPSAPSISCEYTDGIFPATVTIEYGTSDETEIDATKLFYEINGGVIMMYSAPIVLNENCTITAYARDYVDPIAYQGSDPSELVVSVEPESNLPIISPNGGTYYPYLPQIFAINPSGLRRTVMWEWTDPTDPEPEYTNQIEDQIGPVIVNYGFSGGEKKLWVKEIHASGETDPVTAVFRLEQAIERGAVTDGFDNKLSVRDIQVVAPASRSTIKVELSMISEPAAFTEYGEETVSEMIDSGHLPRYSVPLLVTVTPFNKDEALLPVKKTTLYVSTKARKQYKAINAVSSSETMDFHKSKRSMTVYTNSEVDVKLNIYDYSTLFMHCFSVVIKQDNKEIFPGNFFGDPTINGDFTVNNISVVSELRSGRLLLAISYRADVEMCAYLHVEDSKNFYPGLSHLVVRNYLLSEVIVPLDAIVLPNRANYLEMSMRSLSGGYDIAPDGLNTIRFNRYNTKLIRRLMQATLVSGNSLAVAMTNRNVLSAFSFGWHGSAMSNLVETSGLYSWLDGNEKYSPVMSFPMIIPYDYYYLANDLPVVISSMFDADHEDNNFFSVIPGNSIHRSNQMEVFKGFTRHYQISEVSVCGTVHIITTPRLELGGVYSVVSETIKDMEIEFSNREHVYGDRTEGAALHTSAGLFTPSRYPFMASTRKRVSAFGTSSEVIVLENYVFAKENGFACLYAFNEKNGKILLHNEKGSFVNRPIVYKGRPVFAVNTGNQIRLYSGSENGIILSRIWDAADALMNYEIGGIPTIFIKTNNGYDVWNVDSAIYLNTKMTTDLELYLKTEYAQTGMETKLCAPGKVITVQETNNSKFKIESSEVYPSSLSYEYEGYQYFCNGVVIRFDTTSKSQTRQAIEDDPTSRASIKVKYNGSNVLAEHNRFLVRPEVKIMFDLTEVNSLSYAIESNAPIRSIRFTGYFIESLKEGDV